jgi:hypothetical protein
MILTTAAVLSLFGIVAFAIGSIYGHPGVAMFGAIIIIGVGGTGVVDGIQIKTGETHTETNNTTVIEDNYEDITTHSQFPFPVVWLLFGAVLLVSSLGEASEK